MARPPAGGGGRQPKALIGPPVDGKPTFSFRYIDRGYDGLWGWVKTHEHASEVLTFLCEMSKDSWNEIGSHRTGGERGSYRKHHSQPIETLCPEARQRLAELELDEIFEDDIFRFRLGNKKRLWGFRVDGVFYVLWWDPDHKVYPTEPS